MHATDPNEAKDKAAELLDSAATSLRNTAVEHGGQAGRFASQAAETIDSTAGYLRQHDIQEMATQAQQTLKRYPGAALAAAAGFGFLLGVALRRR